MGNAHCRTCSMVRKPKNMENKKHTVGHGIFRETLKKVKKNAHCRTSKMAIKLEKEKNQKLTEQDLEYGEKH